MASTATCTERCQEHPPSCRSSLPSLSYNLSPNICLYPAQPLGSHMTQILQRCRNPLCQELHVCVSPKLMLKPNSQGDGIWVGLLEKYLGLNEVMRACPLIRQGQDLTSLSQAREDTAIKWQQVAVCKPRERSPQNQPGRHPISNQHPVACSLLFKPPAYGILLWQPSLIKTS